MSQVSEHGLDAPAHVQLLIDVVQVGFHRVERHAELISNVFVAATGRRTGQNFLFSIGQQHQSARARRLLPAGQRHGLLGKPVRHEGRSDRLTPWVARMMRRNS